MLFTGSSRMRFTCGSFLWFASGGAKALVVVQWRFCVRIFGQKAKGLPLTCWWATRARSPFGGRSVTETIVWHLKYYQAVRRVPNKGALTHQTESRKAK